MPALHTNATYPRASFPLCFTCASHQPRPNVSLSIASLTSCARSSSSAAGFGSFGMLCAQPRGDVTGSHSLTGFESNSNLWELCNFCSGFPKFDRTQNITACTTITTTTAATTTSSSTRCGTVVFASCAHCPRAQVLEPWVTI
jgi:hypothetical protein